MAGKKKQVNENYYDMPETLDNHQFYGLKLDDEQKIFRDAIWSDKTPVVFCNAKAGTGKTLIATATANLLVQYHKYNGIVYIAAPVMESKQGFLKGSLEEKSIPYFEPFYEALVSIGVNINTAICDDYENDKFGTSYIKCLTNTFLRGCNFENKVIIVDESQNNYFDELIEEAQKLWSELVEKDPNNSAKILKLVENTMGRPMRISEIVPDQVGFLDLIVQDMRDLV